LWVCTQRTLLGSSPRRTLLCLNSICKDPPTFFILSLSSAE
jgi:hypothetical protein